MNEARGVESEIVEIEAPELPRTGWGMAPARGVYYRPAGRWPKTAFIVAHYNLDFSRHYLAELLARRGYGLLGWNTRFCGRDAVFVLDRALADVGLAVRWLRERGAELVVLLGNSGGGSLLAAYQAQSRHAFVRPPYGMGLATGMDELPPGDLYVSVAAHPGRPEVLTGWLDPAVVDELDPLATDPALDMYNVQNGPPYSPEFVSRYRKAQSARNDRVTSWCKRELGRLNGAGHSDRLFTLHRTWADLRFVDPTLDPSERPTPACYRGDPMRANRGIDGIGSVSSLRTWLSMWSLEESQCRSAESLRLIDDPALVIQASADTGVFPSDARAIFESLGSRDKQFVTMPGDHYFRGPGSPRGDLAELIDSWVQARSGGA